jgi:maleylacetoacetate isomerase
MYNLKLKLPIIEYLQETRPSQGPNLLPIDPIKRVKARSISEIINSGIQPYQNANVLKRLVVNMGEEKKNEWIKFYLDKGFKALEQALEETSGKYCVGDDVTIADLCLVPQVYSANRFNVDLTAYPNVRRVNSALEQLPAFRKAHAHRQPDTYPELKED